MVLPGIQALFGFQLIAVFNNRFTALGPLEQQLHYAALVLVALSVILIMAPASYHRIVQRSAVSPFTVKLTSVLTSTAMAPLIVSLAIEVYVVGWLISQDTPASAALAIALLTLGMALWFGLPLLRYRDERP